MNKSEILKAVEWVDQSAKDGDVVRLAKAKQVLEQELASHRTTSPPEEAYKIALESFVRKHGREPMEDIVSED